MKQGAPFISNGLVSYITSLLPQQLRD
uniref:Uncharacterized protein n=1 Tax=Arundo donax TaxID=35708 RepID=A0A0A8ZD72_ARUDO